VVTTPEEIARRGDLIGPILRPALRDGQVLYDAENESSMLADGKLVQPARPPRGGVVTAEERLSETRRWLRQAHEDLRVAELLADGDNAAPHQACYFAQQAAEKALKAVLVFLQIEYPTSHNFDQLRDLVPMGWPLKQEYPDLEGLTDWVIKGRYPGDWPDPTTTDSRNAARQARALWDSVLRDLQRHGLDVAEYR
jgi:HEPN domain-containing protein